MSNHGENNCEEWTHSKDFIHQNTEYLERLNPAVYGHYIAQRQAQHDAKSIKNFKVTRLPQGGRDDYQSFRPKQAPTGRKAKGEKDDAKDAEKALRDKEAKIMNGLFDEREDSPGNK